MAYYRGDYYRGDPFLGAIGGLIGGLAKRALPVIGRAIGIGKKVVARHPTATGIAIGAVAPAFAGSGGGGPAGYHEKPGFKGKIQRLLPGGESGYIRNRRMNVTNVRALRRAGRRVRGFLKLARRLGALPVSSRGKGKLFKTARRRK